MHLYMIRHGQSHVNLAEWDSGNTDEGLTELGQKQAAALAQWLPKQVPAVNALYTSTMRRACPDLSIDTASAMSRKAVNDSVAWLRGLAELRGRNADWAERAVREAVSITSEEALETGVIDLVASDLDELLLLNARTEMKTMASPTASMRCCLGFIVYLQVP